jgi:DNA-binding response OmpR family regulator
MVSAVVRKILIKDNFDVIECADGEKAIATIEKERPDLVLLDIVMPGIDGNEVLRRIRATEFGKQLPVLILTSSDTLVAENSDASGRLSKPFKPYDLLLKLKAYFPVNESDAL